MALTGARFADPSGGDPQRVEAALWEPRPPLHRYRPGGVPEPVTASDALLLAELLGSSRAIRGRRASCGSSVPAGRWVSGRRGSCARCCVCLVPNSEMRKPGDEASARYEGVDPRYANLPNRTGEH